MKCSWSFRRTGWVLIVLCSLYIPLVYLYCSWGDNEKHWWHIERNKERIHRGMSSDEVIGILGKPALWGDIKQQQQGYLGDKIMEYSKHDLIGFGFTVYDAVFSDDIVSVTHYYCD